MDGTKTPKKKRIEMSDREMKIKRRLWRQTKGQTGKHLWISAENKVADNALISVTTKHLRPQLTERGSCYITTLANVTPGISRLAETLLADQLLYCFWLTRRFLRRQEPYLDEEAMLMCSWYSRLGIHRLAQPESGNSLHLPPRRRRYSFIYGRRLYAHVGIKGIN